MNPDTPIIPQGDCVKYLENCRWQFDFLDADSRITLNANIVRSCLFHLVPLVPVETAAEPVAYMDPDNGDVQPASIWKISTNSQSIFSVPLYHYYADKPLRLAVEGDLYPLKHSHSCSNQNPLNWLSAYDGAEECGCRK
jgi:hypothetical protein